ncbi:hypothetical protein BB934_31805 (plasmid) [Microvirga ossetica]|uniref:Uncharacterized protein n=1 Tax=Microvirga ossetica TaxID=1882682 RepID=A0A1B2ES65_9HYPH|nr:hypothetical protein [Microvirga ossetica]ANY82823.1 hypothetical protein BB934_31805 [Microvirga ossetica]
MSSDEGEQYRSPEVARLGWGFIAGGTMLNVCFGTLAEAEDAAWFLTKKTRRKWCAVPFPQGGQGKWAIEETKRPSLLVVK